MTNKDLNYRVIKLFILVPTFLLIFSSCDIIDKITDTWSGNPDLEDWNFTDITKVEVDIYLDKANSKLTYNDGTTPTDYVNGGQHSAHFTSIAGEIEATGNYFQSFFWGYPILGQTITGYMEIKNLEEGGSLDNPAFLKITVRQTKLWNSFVFGDVEQDFKVDYLDLPFYQSYTEDGKLVDEYYESGSTVNKIITTFKENNDLYTDELISFNCGAGAYIRAKLYHE